VPIAEGPEDILLATSAPEPSRMYLRADGHVLVQDIDHPLDITHAAEVDAPQNLVADVIRPWPGTDALCEFVLARVVDAGGAAHRELGPGASPSPRSLDDVVVFVRASDLSSARVEGGTASATVAEANAARNEAARAAAAAESEEEARTGRCSDRRRADLEQLLQRDAEIARGLDDGVWIAVGHEYVVARPEGVEVVFSPTLSGEYHVFAVGVPPVVLSVADRSGASASLTSPYEPLFASADDQSDSRVFQGRIGEVFHATVRGTGCALVMAFARD
jgi:hypothetical protein